MNKKLLLPGDWNCTSCHHFNFSWRDTCQRCGDPCTRRLGEFGRYSSREHTGTGSGAACRRPSVYGGGSFPFGGGGSDKFFQPGDWYCSIASCNAHNFANRSQCFKCGAFKEDTTVDITHAFESLNAFESLSIAAGAKLSRRSSGFGRSFIPGGKVRSASTSGDWICGRLACCEYNFASRKECFRCTAPRESGVPTSDNYSK